MSTPIPDRLCLCTGSRGSYTEDIVLTSAYAPALLVRNEDPKTREQSYEELKAVRRSVRNSTTPMIRLFQFFL